MKGFVQTRRSEHSSTSTACVQEDGQVTAGNASTLNDGASAVLVPMLSLLRQQGWEILAYHRRLLSQAVLSLLG